MKKDIYKKGLSLLAIIVVVLITFFGYMIDKNKKNTSVDFDVLNDQKSHDEQGEQEEQKNNEKEEEIIDLIVVDISGAVKNPGIYELNEGMRVNDAIDAAGGLSDDANSEYISKHMNKARVLYDEEKLYIPKIEDDVSSIEVSSVISSENNKTVGKININTASKDQLVTLKGIGESFAQRIIDYRKDCKFKSIEDIKNVKGIGDKTFENIRDYITIE